MRIGRTTSRMAAVLSLAAAAAAGCGSNNGGNSAGKSGIHKIQHVIVIMQENRSFDSYFGTFPGADGIPMTNGVPAACLPSTAGPCIRPTVDHRDVNGGGPHGAANATADINGGKMDGFVTQAESARKGCGSRPP